MHIPSLDSGCAENRKAESGRLCCDQQSQDEIREQGSILGLVFFEPWMEGLGAWRLLDDEWKKIGRNFNTLELEELGGFFSCCSSGKLDLYNLVNLLDLLKILDIFELLYIRETYLL